MMAFSQENDLTNSLNTNSTIPLHTFASHLQPQQQQSLPHQRKLRITTTTHCMFPLIPSFDYTNLSMGLVILILNGFTLYLFFTRKFLRHLAGNYILASLSLNDLLNGMYVLFTLFPKFYLHNNECAVKQFQFFQLEMPTISRTVYRALMLSSVLHLVLLSTDRLIYVMRALTYDILITKQKIRRFLLTTWLGCIAAASVQLLWSLPNGPLYRYRKVGADITTACELLAGLPLGNVLLTVYLSHSKVFPEGSFFAKTLPCTKTFFTK